MTLPHQDRTCVPKAQRCFEDCQTATASGEFRSVTGAVEGTPGHIGGERRYSSITYVCSSSTAKHGTTRAGTSLSSGSRPSKLTCPVSELRVKARSERRRN